MFHLCNKGLFLSNSPHHEIRTGYEPRSAAMSRGFSSLSKDLFSVILTVGREIKTCRLVRIWATDLTSSHISGLYSNHIWLMIIAA